MSDMQGRVCLGRRATTGMPRLARALCPREGDVVLHGRSPEKCRRVHSRIAAETAARSPRSCSAISPRARRSTRAASEYLESGNPCTCSSTTRSRQPGPPVQRRGNELTFAVTTWRCSSSACACAAPAREHPGARRKRLLRHLRMRRSTSDDLQLERGYSSCAPMRAAALATVYFTLDAPSRRSRAAASTVNAVDTVRWRQTSGQQPRSRLRIVSRHPRALPSPYLAARTALMLATDPKLEAATGGYYRSGRKRERPLAFDPEVSGRLWRVSAELTRVDL